MVTQDKAVNPKVREAAVIYSLAEAPAGQLVPMGFAPWKASFIRDYIIYKGLPIAMCDFRKAYGLANCWNWTWQGELPISQEFNGEIIHNLCIWKKSCTTLDGWNPRNNGINHLLVQDFFHPLYAACCIGQLLLVVCLKGNPLGYRPEIQPWALHRTPNTGASMGSFPDISDSSSNPNLAKSMPIVKKRFSDRSFDHFFNQLNLWAMFISYFWHH